MYGFLLGVLQFFLFLISPFTVASLIYYIDFKYLKKVKSVGFPLPKLKKVGFFKRIFFLFPQRWVLDGLTRNRESFCEHGIHIIAGEQGSGKSITLTYLLLQYQAQYPKLVVKTNYGYAHEQASITHWKDVVASENGVYGEINVLDEIQNWFSSLASKDFPVEMLEELTQQRKQRKMIIGTSQVFSRVAKPLREQTTYLYEPFTILGCLTVCRVYKPSMSVDGLTANKKLRRMFFFVHSDEIRNSFDTYKKIQKYKDIGFQKSPFMTL